MILLGTHVCCFAVVVGAQHVPSESKVCYFDNEIIGDQNIAGRQITVNTLREKKQRKVHNTIKYTSLFLKPGKTGYCESGSVHRCELMYVTHRLYSFYRANTDVK